MKAEEAEVIEVRSMEGKGSENEEFLWRHIGPNESEQVAMLKDMGLNSVDDLIAKTVPESIRFDSTFEVSGFEHAFSESEALKWIKDIARSNKIFRSYIGMGYYNCFTPTVIQRNILENPGWYTQYTPYQPEISQGRLEALLNFQTLVSDLTGLPIANSSLLDEATAAAEAMTMSLNVVSKTKKEANIYYASDRCHPQTLNVLKTRAEGLGIELVIGAENTFDFDDKTVGVLIQYPDTYGAISDYSELVKAAQGVGALVTFACDLLSLVLLKSPAFFNADIAIGNSQRFGVPFGYGGPHAAFFATKQDFKRLMPGRLVGVSKNREGKDGLRLALQTREQHIRREKATSNICTAQVLLAIMAGMYAVYHGPKGLRQIARKVNDEARVLATKLKTIGFKIRPNDFFDTIIVDESDQDAIKEAARKKKVNFRYFSDGAIGISLDETVTARDISDIVEIFHTVKGSEKTDDTILSTLSDEFLRTDEILTHPVFNHYHTETEFLRYVRRLESRDLSLGTAMIPLGSCTMKLNATSEMLPVTWEGFAGLHPFAPENQSHGYQAIFSDLEGALADITGLDAVSLQPNAGSQGEYAGLMAIMAYLRANKQKDRNICLIPQSAHGTNPASAVMAGLKVVVVKCDDQGNIDLEDLETKIEAHKENLAALMVTYPSTHGVFEEAIKEICNMVHAAGGQVYFDGANLNAMVGISKVGDLGADVVHINLHKTFCIPHGGGGPGMGPIAVKEHLRSFLPGDPLSFKAVGSGLGPVSAANWGSSSILPISWMYMAMMGSKGLKRASEVAILNANYIAKKLEKAFPVLYKGKNGYVAHECILDVRAFKQSAGVEVEDIAKRLMDYGFHAPTISWPVPGTMMIEPTESESKAELDRFCNALLAIRKEIEEIEKGAWPQDNNPLVNAPHTATMVTSDSWERPYTREIAAFPDRRLKEYKFWPASSRIDSVYGDKNLVCTCPDISEYE